MENVCLLSKLGDNFGQVKKLGNVMCVYLKVSYLLP